MAAIDEVIQWANKEIPGWQGDAVRRLLTQTELTTQDKTDLLGMLKTLHGLVEPQVTFPKPIPIQSGQISGSPQVKINLVIKKIGDVKSVNAIPDGSYIPFGHEGLTVIYGENGAGKTGYARVLKRACSAKDSSAPILPDVITGKSQGSASATFTVSADGKIDQNILWCDGKEKNDSLSNIVVFDEKEARAIVDDENDVTFLPYGTHVFGVLAELLKEFKTKLESEKPTAVLPEFPEIKKNTKSQGFLNSVTASTSELDLNAVANWSAGVLDHLNKMKAQIAEAEAPDRNTKIRSLKTIVSDIEGLQSKIANINKVLSIENAESLEKILNELDIAEQALILVTQKSTVSEPLPGVRSEAWQSLYSAAKDYSLKEAYPGRVFPFVDEGARCVFCMQPISVDAGERLHRFQTFMEQTEKQNRDNALTVLKSKTAELESLNFGSFDNSERVIQELTERFPQTSSKLKVYVSSALKRSQQMISALNSKTYTPLHVLPEAPVVGIEEALKAFKVETDGLETITPKELESLKQEVSELEARQSLDTHRNDVLKYVETLRKIGKYDEAIGETGLHSVSAWGKKIISAAITPQLQKALKNEMKLLGAAYLPIETKSTRADGEVVHKLTLTKGTLPKKVQLTQVLSEGEQKVIAIAGFLSEVCASGTKNPMVFDDPVSSLDHLFKDKIAYRLALEAKERQVIIFTHDIGFLLALQDHAAEIGGVKMVAQTIYRKELTPGHSAQGAPWHAMTVGQRLDYLGKKLLEFEGQHQKDLEKYNEEAGNFYGKLRETWEALVEEDLLNKVVRRHGAGIQTLRLSEAQVLNDDYKEVFFGMKKCSEWMTGHDKSKAMDVNRPDPSEIKGDIDKLQKYRKEIGDRAKKIKPEREALCRPQIPKVG